MPKLGVEPMRRAALVKAAIAEIGAQGTLAVTVSQIARRAGVSGALAHHYFGGKEQILVGAMRHVMAEYRAEVLDALGRADHPAARVRAIVEASFCARNFGHDTVAAWLNFYVLAQTSQEARRLLGVYQRRLRSNLCHALRPLIDARAGAAAERVAALIDGAYLRQSLGVGVPDGAAAVDHVMGYVTLELERHAA